MADLAAQKVTATGLAPTVHAASATGDTFPFGALVRVDNGGAAEITVTLITPGVVDGNLAIADRAITIPAGQARYVRPSLVFRNPETLTVALTYSATASVTVEVVE